MQSTVPLGGAVFTRVGSHSICLCLFLLMFAGIESRQGFAQPQARNEESPERRLPHDLFQDQKAIWTSPAHIKKHDLKWLLPFVVGTAGLIVTDPHNAKVLGGSDKDDLSLSHGVANAGFGVT